MAHSPTDDISRSPPKGPNGEPLQSFEGQVDTVLAALEVVVEDPQTALETAMGDVLDLDESERFTDSLAVVEGRFREEGGGLDDIRDGLDVNQETILSSLVEVISHIQEETATGVFYERNAEAVVILVGTYDVMLGGLSRVARVESTAAERRIMSALLGLLARIYDAAFANDEGPNRRLGRIALDALWADHIVADACGETTEIDPTEATTDEALAELREFGAAVIYAKLDISVSRGAELAQLSVDEFEQALEEYRVAPRYGPQSVEILREE